MVVDDSAVVRQTLQALLDREPDIEVVATASDPLFALDKMNKHWPDVIVLDIKMPRMDGITFLKKIMAEHPTPVVICSSLAEQGSPVAMQAVEAGAVEIITKPQVGLRQYFENTSAELVAAVRAASQSKIRQIRTRLPSTLEVAPKLSADAMLPAPGNHTVNHTTERIVAIGTSTGGTQALEVVLTALPRGCPGIVVVQHMPEKFTASFATRLDQLSRIDVREAADGDRVFPSLALIAPGGKHMLLKRTSQGYQVEIKDGPLVNRHRPSVDVLFRSVAKYAGKNAVGIIMTGMGDDGAHGLKEMHDAGATTYAQDEETCVVFGMPKEAIKLGAADVVLPLQDIPGVIA
ncbi:MAG: chemotaxis response regulator protein-glutamate methylesterase [Sulfuricella sp.]|nr:chemotaxis response regulator protein-glutamate methylesterase [Sulfuricella sp.]